MIYYNQYKLRILKMQMVKYSSRILSSHYLIMRCLPIMMYWLEEEIDISLYGDRMDRENGK